MGESVAIENRGAMAGAADGDHLDKISKIQAIGDRRGVRAKERVQGL